MIFAFVDYLATYYQTGNFAQMAAIARTMQAIVPDDVVSLQFLGLALYQMGSIDAAYLAFNSAATRQDQLEESVNPIGCETARAAILRAATRPDSGLADAWYCIALALNKFGLLESAARTIQALSTARGWTMKAS